MVTLTNVGKRCQNVRGRNKPTVLPREYLDMRALLSVYEKDGLELLAAGLVAEGWELVSSGGTSKKLAAAGIPHRQVEDVTGFPEAPEGLVKTLHPAIHGGILIRRDKPAHMDWLHQMGYESFDAVFCNLYPFKTDPSIEMIDIGGPTMVRAAAKRWAQCTVVVDPADYALVMEEIRDQGNTCPETRERLARKAFAHTAAYDAAIVAWLDDGDLLPPTLHPTLVRSDLALRYGENPHQAAAVYRIDGQTSWLDGMIDLGVGIRLGYLNLYDADAAWRLVHALEDEPAVAIIKHANPCGVAIADDLPTAYQRAYDCDPLSAFGGIVACNRIIDLETAARIVAGAQADVFIAPGYEPGVIEMLVKRRKNARIIAASPPGAFKQDYRQINGAFLVQEAPSFKRTRVDWKVVTDRLPTDNEWADLEFAWRLQDYAKSNTIIVVCGGVAYGIGVGQQNRRDSAMLATTKAKGRAEGGAVSSDAFFPFPDALEDAALSGATAVIQPGGAQHDADVIAAANQLGLAMVFTGERHFRH